MSQASFDQPATTKYKTVLRNTVITDDSNSNKLLQNKFMTYYTHSRIENKPLLKKQLLEKQKIYNNQKESQHSIDEIAKFEAKFNMNPKQIKPIIIQPLTNDEKDKLETLLPPRYLQYYDIYPPNDSEMNNLTSKSKLETSSLLSHSTFKSTGSHSTSKESQNNVSSTIKSRDVDLSSSDPLSSSRSQSVHRAAPGSWCFLDEPLIPTKPFGIISKPTVHDRPFIQTSCCSRSSIPLLSPELQRLSIRKVAQHDEYVRYVKTCQNQKEEQQLRKRIDENLKKNKERRLANLKIQQDLGQDWALRKFTQKQISLMTHAQQKVELTEEQKEAMADLEK